MFSFPFLFFVAGGDVSAQVRCGFLFCLGAQYNITVWVPERGAPPNSHERPSFPCLPSKVIENLHHTTSSSSRVFFTSLDDRTRTSIRRNSKELTSYLECLPLGEPSRHRPRHSHPASPTICWDQRQNSSRRQHSTRSCGLLAKEDYHDGSFLAGCHKTVFMPRPTYPLLRV